MTDFVNSVGFQEAMDYAARRKVVLPEDYYGKLIGLQRSQAVSIAGLAALEQIRFVVDKLAGAEMLVLNRMTPGADVTPYHKIARAVNRRIEILYEYTDGSTHYDDIEDPLPFDLNAPVVEVKDEDYALFYRDITEEPKKYAGKTVKFKGQVARLRREKEGMFAPGRFVMTCCEADITFMGLPCRFAGASGLAARSWVWVTATVEVKYHSLYKGVGPILTAVNVQPAEPAEQSVATF